MLSLRSRRTTFSKKTTLMLGGVAMAMMAGSPARCGELVRIGDRCTVYGPGFVDLGNGTCGQTGTRSTAGWTGGGTANAGLRSDGYGMLPGAGNARHLRIQVDPDFR